MAATYLAEGGNAIGALRSFWRLAGPIALQGAPLDAVPQPAGIDYARAPVFFPADIKVDGPADRNVTDSRAAL